jgi:flagellar assembly protein FliH
MAREQPNNRILHDPEVEEAPIPEGARKARHRILRDTAAREVPRHLFGEEPASGPGALRQPGWASAITPKLRAWWPGQEPASEPAPPPPTGDRLHEEEFELAEDQREALMGAAAHLEQVYEETFAEARQAGHQEGLEQGWAEGRQLAHQEAEAHLGELRGLISLFQGELRQLAELRRKTLIDAEEQAVELALSIGERLAERALLGDTRWVGPLMREAAEALTEADRVVCRVSPELGRRLRHADAMPEIDGVFEISEDLGPLDLIVESHCGRVDASFSERLAQLRRAVHTRVHEVEAAPRLRTNDSLDNYDTPTMDGAR